jgi:hypothetical protein
MRVRDEILKCVFFLGVGSPDRLTYEGTGLFVSIRSEASPDRRYVYLVTARHNLERAPRESGSLYLRINTMDTGSQLVPASVLFRKLVD